MSRRLRSAIGFALLATLITSISAFAKGSFSFITITGTKLKEEIRSSDPALTEDFFAFADFYRDRTQAPADPGTGYEITRYYIEGQGEIAFDSLHYYPETGFVFYDGIAGGGSSEYDGKWYTAQPDVKAIFEAALPAGSMNEIQSTTSTGQMKPRTSLPLFPLIVVTAVGIAGILFFTYRLRKASTH